MRITDIFVLSSKAIASQSLRSSFILVAMTIAVASVILLTSLGASARLYVNAKFASLGTNLLIVLPGRSETTGGPPPILGATPRDLTLDDSIALMRSKHIARVAPVAVGSAPVSWQGREREVSVLGSTHQLKSVRHLEMRQGRFLPQIPADKTLPVCVIGKQVRDELFGTNRVLGQWLRVGDRRFRVIGVLASEGQSIGVDFDDLVVIPVASALTLFNSASLFRILAEAKTRGAVPAAATDIRKIIKLRHEGEDDVTVITQDSVVKTFDKILNAFTITVASIAGISLMVAGILIMNVMLVSVSQRTAEIGLLKAIGASSTQLGVLFITEALLLSTLGAFCGLALSYSVVAVLLRLYPTFPIIIPIWALISSLGVAINTSLIFGVFPAIRASKLDPIEALSRR